MCTDTNRTREHKKDRNALPETEGVHRAPSWRVAGDIVNGELLAMLGVASELDPVLLDQAFVDGVLFADRGEITPRNETVVVGVVMLQELSYLLRWE